MLSTLRVSGNWKKACKGQSGLELMVLTTFALLIFSAAYIIITSKTISAVESGAHEEARNVADRVASEINAAVAEGNGYSKSFRLPDSIGGSNYSISVERAMVFIERPKQSVAGYIVIENITGNFTYGWNTIKNAEGVIIVNKTI